jgi:curli biogenesis system outer membrane secretion channel CsgG
MTMTTSARTLRGRVRWRGVLCLAALTGWLLGCATGVGPHGEGQPGGPDEGSISFPPYSGPKRRVQVIEIKIPAEDIRRYPELAEKRVGFGLSNILVETLYDTHRFTFLEEKEQVLKRLVELWELTQDGILVKNPMAPETALQAPDFLVYAEIFDFVPCSPVEKLGFLSKNLSCVTSVGVQVRIGNTATGEYVPGSTDPLSPEGKYVHTVHVPLFGDARLAFDQSAIGKATLKATRYAVFKALQRFQRVGL